MLRLALALALGLAASVSLAQPVSTGRGTVQGLPLGARNGVTTLEAEGGTLYAGPRLVVVEPGGQVRFAADNAAFRPATAPEARAYSIDARGPAVWVGLGFSDTAADAEQPVPTAAGFAVSDDGGRTWRYRFPPADGASVTTVRYGASTLYAEPVTTGAFAPPYGLAIGDGEVFVAGGLLGLRRTRDGGASWQRVVLPPDTLRTLDPRRAYAFPIAPVGARLPDGSTATAGYNFEAFSALVDAGGTLWVGTAGGLNRSDASDVDPASGDRAWRRFVTDPARPEGSPTGNFVIASAEQTLADGARKVWFATWPSPLAAGGTREEYGVTVWTGDGPDGQPLFTTHLRGTIVNGFAFSGARVYAAAQDGLYVSDDEGRSWRATRTFRGADGQPLPIRPAAPVFAAAVTAGPQGSVVWAGTSEGLLRSADAGQTWTVFRSSVPTRPDEPRAEAPAVDVYAYPNPFSPLSGGLLRIRLDLAQAGSVRVRIFDFGMNLVRELDGGDRPAGAAEVLWDGTSEAGTRVPNGAYVYLVDAGGRQLAGRLLILN